MRNLLASVLVLAILAPALPKTTVQGVSVINGSPLDPILEKTGPEGAYEEGHAFTVKSGSTFALLIRNAPDPKKLSLTFKVLNTDIGPREHLTLNLKDETP